MLVSSMYLLNSHYDSHSSYYTSEGVNAAQSSMYFNFGMSVDMDAGRWLAQAECTCRHSYNGIVFSFNTIKCTEKGEKCSIMRSCAIMLQEHTTPQSAGSVIALALRSPTEVTWSIGRQDLSPDTSTIQYFTVSNWIEWLLGILAKIVCLENHESRLSMFRGSAESQSPRISLSLAMGIFYKPAARRAKSHSLIISADDVMIKVLKCLRI